MLIVPLLIVPKLATNPPRSSSDFPPRSIVPPGVAGPPMKVVLPPPRTRLAAVLLSAPPGLIVIEPLLTNSLAAADPLTVMWPLAELVTRVSVLDAPALTVSEPPWLKLTNVSLPESDRFANV